MKNEICHVLSVLYCINYDNNLIYSTTPVFAFYSLMHRLNSDLKNYVFLNRTVEITTQHWNLEKINKQYKNQKKSRVFEQ